MSPGKIEGWRSDAGKGVRMAQRVERVLDILARMFEGETVCTSSLAADYFPHSRDGIRSIQKDFELLRTHLGFLFHKGPQRGCWRIAHRYLGKPIVLEEVEKIVLLFGLDLTEPSEHLRTISGRIEKKLLDDDESPIFFKGEGIEDLDMEDTDVRILQDAIAERKVVEFIDEEGERIYVEPYKIVNLEGIWYLFGRRKGISKKEKDKLDLWMLSQISSLAEIPLAAEWSEKEEKAIETILEQEVHSPFFEDGSRFKVKVRVAPSIAHQFEKKAFLRTQEIVSREPDGSIIVRFTVTHDEDVDNLIKSWLPDIEVLEPKRFRNRIARELEDYLRRVGKR